MGVRPHWIFAMTPTSKLVASPRQPDRFSVHSPLDEPAPSACCATRPSCPPWGTFISIRHTPVYFIGKSYDASMVEFGSNVLGHDL